MLEQLKQKTKITKQDITELLASLGSPGENREAKINAVKELNLANFQGIKVEEVLESYREF